MKTRSNRAVVASLFVFFGLPVLFCSAAPSVTFVAGTSAGWDFHELDADIARNNTVDWSDLSIFAQYWLASGCGDADQWCVGADIDGSSGVDMIDYALLANGWSKQGAKDVLLQTIYGTAQDSSGNITANAYRAVQINKGLAMAFSVSANTTLDKGMFKIFANPWRVGEKLQIRLFNVTGKNYLVYNHSGITKSNPGGGGTLLMDVTATTPSPVPYHSELGDGRQYTDMVIDFGQLDVTTGEYFITLDALGPSNTWGSFVRSGNATDSDKMGKYPDGTSLPKRATVTISSATGNTYYYQLDSTSATSYTPYSYMFPFQITIANRPPAVNAGTDQILQYPNNIASLAGTASDDGIPVPPGVFTITWSVVSGPGTVAFDDTSALNTTAVFSELGTYVLRLTANDGVLSAYDDITITYLQNQPPEVDAGIDRTVGILDVTTLFGTVSDDGYPNPPAAVTITWTQQSGPGTATFANANAATTTVTFSETGVYVLRLTVSDDELSDYDEVTLTVLEGSVNNAPYVNAGPDQIIVAPVNSVTLDATVADDGMPDPPGAVTTTWTKQSGPGTVTFGDIHAVVTTATFSTYGTYVLRLTASDSLLTSYSDTSITYSWSDQSPVPELYPTIHSVGIRLSYPGNPQHLVEYRLAGTSSWQLGHRLTAITNGRLAGSLFWLEPNSLYEVKITVGNEAFTGEVTTRADSPPESLGVTYYVATDGNDANQGTSTSPFATIGKAVSIVGPGDTVIVRSGTYQEVITITAAGTVANPIRFKSETPLGAVIDGGGSTTVTIVRLVGASNIIIEGFTLQNAKGGLVISDSSGCWITGNEIRCTDEGIQILKNTSHNNVIQYNHIWDPTPEGTSSGRNTGVNMEGGRGSIVRYNEVHGFSNGIGSGNTIDAGLLYNESINPDIDVYENVVYDIRDDALEPEGTCINNRLWGNRILNSFVAISLAPIGVGPAYVIRNTIFESAPIKFHLTWGCRPTYVYHNTSFKGSLGGYGLKTYNLGSSRNVVFRNNIFHSWGSYVLYGPGGNLDYNLYFYTGSTYPFKWGSLSYSTLEEFQAAAGEELHGLLDDPLFVDAWGQDFRIQPASPALDAGVHIPGINDNYEGLAPDMGTFELE